MIAALALVTVLAACMSPEEARIAAERAKFCADRGYPADSDDPACDRAIITAFCARVPICPTIPCAGIW